MDDRISVSIENPHTDPAGINFDVNNLNPAESDGMSATLTNYLYNIINRRNAVDIRESSENNSEISVKFCSFQVNSRRNSADSQVSVTMSEIKTTQKHKSVNACKMKVKTKKRQSYQYSKHSTSRRASTSSAESERITNQMKSNKYNKNNRIQVGRQSERRSAMLVTSTDINQFKNFWSRHNIKQTTTDDEESIDEAQPLRNAIEAPNMAVPSGMIEVEINGSKESLDSSADNNKQETIEQKLKAILQNSTDKQLEDLLRNSYGKGSNGIGKNIRNSVRSGRISKKNSSRNKMYSTSKNDEHLSANMKKDNDVAISSSKSSTSTSQNSKRSYDVGIQANDYDISPHTRQHSRDEFDKDNFTEKLQVHCNQQDDEYTEMHQLLPPVRKHIISRHLSEAERQEKFKELLYMK